MNLPSKEIMKRKIFEMLDVHKKDGSTSAKTPDRLMSAIWDSKKVGGTYKENPLMITYMIDNLTSPKS